MVCSNNKLWRAVILGSAVIFQAALGTAVRAEVFSIPAPGAELIGEIQYTKAKHEDTLLDVAREFSIGQDEMVMANPAVDRWLPGEGAEVVLPRQYILPDAGRRGIVVNIPEMRMFYFVGGSKNTVPTQVITYPVSIGRMDWKTPLGITRIVQKQKDPVWRPPASIKREHAQDGDFLPDVVPAGPMNPLGKYALKLGVSGYLIHGTGADKEFGIGMRVTHGCIRLYPEDIEQLFPQVAVGTQVTLVNQPIKLGWLGEDLYIEVSQPLDEDSVSYDELFAQAMNLIMKKTAGHNFVLDGAVLKHALETPSGIPVVISKSAEAEPESAGLPDLM